MSTSEEIYKQMLDKISQVNNAGKAISDVLPAIAETFDSSIDTNMLRRGRWDGNAGSIGLFSGGSNRWKPLAKSTQKAYLAQGKNNPLERTLDRTAGGLRSSIEIMPLGRSAIEFSVRGAGRKGVSPKVYAAIQNFGGTINMPARKMTIRLRTKKNKSGKTVTRFASKKHKKSTVSETTSKPYKIVIPPSPFMVLQEEDLKFASDLLGQVIVDSVQ